MPEQNIIAIDGPSGSGKSTVAKLVAEKIDGYSLDSGSLYRAVALGIYESEVAGKKFNSAKEFLELFPTIKVIDNRIYIGDRDVSKLIRDTEISSLTSKIATNIEVREYVNAFMHKYASEFHPLVVEGRDIGSVVFPDALLKIFLNADLEERAKRRSKELNEANENLVLKTLQERDDRDSRRKESPLLIAKGAVVIDTTDRLIDDIVNYIVRLWWKSI